MNRLYVATALALSVGLTAIPAGAVVYCKTAGVPKGCVARPAAAAPGVGAPGIGVAPGVSVGAPVVGVAPGVDLASGASATNRNGGANRVGVRR